MSGHLTRILASAPEVLLHPQRAARLIFKRVAPVGLVFRDREAYAAVGTWTFGKIPRMQLTDVFPEIRSAEVRLLRAFDRNPYGSASVLETVTLAAIVRHIDARQVLEIGTLDGNTTLALAANTADDAVITTVDLPADWGGNMHLNVPPRFLDAANPGRVGWQARDSALAGKVRQILCDSATLDWGTLGGPFDMILIDGCHYYSYVKSDTANAVRQLAPNGIIVWHGYGMIEDVSRAVDEWAQEMKVVAISGTELALGFPDQKPGT